MVILPLSDFQVNYFVTNWSWPGFWDKLRACGFYGITSHNDFCDWYQAGTTSYRLVMPIELYIWIYVRSKKQRKRDCLDVAQTLTHLIFKSLSRKQKILILDHEILKAKIVVQAMIISNNELLHFNVSELKINFS